MRSRGPKLSSTFQSLSIGGAPRRAHGTRALCCSLALSLLSFGFATSLAAQTPPTSKRTEMRYRQLVRQAVDQYQVENYGAAKLSFEQAQQVFPNARALRGLGLVAYAMHDYLRAVDYFERALAEQTKPLTSEQAIEARQLIARAQATDGAPQPVASASEEHVPTGRDRGRVQGDSSSHHAPLVLVGISGAVIVGGGVLLAIALHDKATVENSGPDTHWSQIDDPYHRATSFSTAGILAIATGAAGVAAGLIWHSLTPPRDTPLALHISPWSVQLRSNF